MIPLRDSHTIEERALLPSGGLVYSSPIDPSINLRSMTTQDEMVRLAPSEDHFRTLSDLIENCIIGDKPDLSVYDMCLGDYYFLLNKLRVVTYGSDYSLMLYCPYCQEAFESVVDLDSLPITYWEDRVEDGEGLICDRFLGLLELKLPKSGKTVLLTYQTPRTMDNAARRIKQLKAKDKNFAEEAESLVQKISNSIKEIDGKKMNPTEVEIMVRKMQMADTNLLSQRIDKINDLIGPSKVVSGTCPRCKNDVLSMFRYAPTFFRPDVN